MAMGQPRSERASRGLCPVWKHTGDFWVHIGECLSRSQEQKPWRTKDKRGTAERSRVSLLHPQPLDRRNKGSNYETPDEILDSHCLSVHCVPALLWHAMSMLQKLTWIGLRQITQEPTMALS